MVFISNNSLGPDTWGPYIWASIHYITLGYPSNPSDETKSKYKNFMELFQYVLPCSVCREHLKDNLQKIPITNLVLSNRENFINWGIDLHNEVNKINGKKVLSYDEARYIILNNKFNTHIKTNLNKSDNSLTIISLIIILSVLLFIAIIYKKK